MTCYKWFLAFLLTFIFVSSTAKAQCPNGPCPDRIQRNGGKCIIKTDGSVDCSAAPGKNINLNTSGGGTVNANGSPVGTLTGSGTVNTAALFTGATTIGDSILSFPTTNTAKFNFGSNVFNIGVIQFGSNVNRIQVQNSAGTQGDFEVNRLLVQGNQIIPGSGTGLQITDLSSNFLALKALNYFLPNGGGNNLFAACYIKGILSDMQITCPTAMSDGQLLIGRTGNEPITGNITGTAPITITNGGGTINVSCPTCSTASGITNLNTLTGNTQTFATGTSGSNFNISSSGTTHTFNIPDASATNRGLVTTGTQTFAGDKTFGNLTITGTCAGCNSSLSMLLLAEGQSGTDSIANNTTSFTYPHNYLSTGGMWIGTESSRGFVMPYAGTVDKLVVKTDTANPATQTVVVTIRKNGADTALTLTISPSAGAGIFTDNTHSFSVAQGDRIAIKGVNSAGGAASAVFLMISMRYSFTP